MRIRPHDAGEALEAARLIVDIGPGLLSSTTPHNGGQVG
jgi:hypothetical protein